uniref:N(6)-L-threonylcarbamoyladenine synthase n=1 Tax=Candidozyma auris TaxID=498019 RepID=A0A0L0NY41_CANAR
MLPSRRFLNIRLAARSYRALALESSCDDSCVALLEKQHPSSQPVVIDEMKRTLRSVEAGGVIPTAAHEFHLKVMPDLVRDFCRKHKIDAQNKPDLLCVTRGPGMVGSLSLALQFAKGLSLAWDVPFIGTHHMLGHILALHLPSIHNPQQAPPQYPFLSLLCSGGHTMLVLLKSFTDHRIIINTMDIACGDAIDKAARELGMRGNMIGPELEKYVASIPSSTLEQFQTIRTLDRNNHFNFKLKPPLRKAKHQKVPDTITFTFAFLLSSIKDHMARHDIDEHTKQFLAYKIQDLVFEHLIDRVNLAFQKHLADGEFAGVEDFVCSGGVAANQELRRRLFTELKPGSRLNFHFPDLKICTDNALMIGVAGMGIFEQLRLKSTLDVLPIRKWPLDQLIDAGGWESVDNYEFEKVTGWTEDPRLQEHPDEE